MALNDGYSTHLSNLLDNPVYITPWFDRNDYLPVTNPNVSPPSANRTFGGTSSSSTSTQVYGVKGSSRGIASAEYINKAYLQFGKPQRALAVLRAINDPTINNAKAIVGNGYFNRLDTYGEQLNSNVAGPVIEPTRIGIQTTPLYNPNSLYSQKTSYLGSNYKPTLF